MTRSRWNILLTLLIADLLGVLGAAAASAQSVFTVARPAALAGEQSGRDEFTAAGIVKECPVARFESRLRGPSSTVELEPIYGRPIHSGCLAKALGGLPTKFAWAGCTYLLHLTGKVVGEERWGADVDIRCPSGAALQWYLYAGKADYFAGIPACTTAMQPQTGLGGAELRNLSGAPDRIAIRWNLTGIRYRPSGSSLLCGPLRPRRDASYRGEAIIGARDARGKPTDLTIGG